MVLLEVMNYYSAHGSNLRKAAVTLVERLRAHPHTTLVPLSSVPFQEALGLYAQREDKTWSLTDCATFQIMQNEQITGALTIRTPAILDRCAVE
jgi:predicted nucleic acid-binding protein